MARLFRPWRGLCEFSPTHGLRHGLLSFTPSGFVEKTEFPACPPSPERRHVQCERRPSTMSSPSSRLIRADAGRLASVPESLAPRFRDALAATGFPPSSPDRRELFERRARGGRNLPRLLRMTAAETPLH